MKIYIGTSGYSYQDWIGPVYPPRIEKGEMLRYYSTLFPYVELNFSYYQQPTERILKPMVFKTPEYFRFGIKVHQSLTHERSGTWEKELSIFLEGLSVLKDSGRLSAVLAQFPFSFHYTPENRRYLAELCDALSSLPLVIEFRNRDWQAEQVYKEFQRRELGIVITDSPDIKGLPKPLLIDSGAIIYVRFHGRNAENWWKGDSTSRYDYLYTQKELQEWLPRISLLAEKGKILYLVFNNHYKGQAVKNASQIRELLLAENLM